MVRFPLLPTLASCLLALTAQAQSATKAKPAPDKPAAVQPFAPAATTEDHEPVLAPNAAPDTRKSGSRRNGWRPRSCRCCTTCTSPPCVEKIESMEIYNALGEKIFSFTTPQTEIDLTKQPAGMYFLSARTKDKTGSKKIVKQ